ncbi:MAG: outer membrane lipoprotein carrier protein LolA [Gemmatimonadetes bacterium]|nr:outer membrane lipoprotein carrier protein LolA [Gemmatimonadota bacterium]
MAPLAIAACGTGREAQSDGNVQVNTTRTREQPVVASGGDTAATAQPQPAASATPSTSTAAAPKTATPAPAAHQAAAPASKPAAGTQEANEILRRVEETAAGVRTLEADFVQNLKVPLLGTDRRSTGKLYQRKPDRFLMRFTDPAGDVMVADGRFFWIYYPSSDRTQVIRTSIAQGGEQADFQRQFLSNATSRFVATLNGEEMVGGRPTWALTLVPKRDSPYKVIRIWVDKQDNLVRRFEMTEENDSVRRLELSNLKVNQPISDALFAFTPPAGTHIFEQ